MSAVMTVVAAAVRHTVALYEIAGVLALLGILVLLEIVRERTATLSTYATLLIGFAVLIISIKLAYYS